jgi:hypothetical protein
MSEDIHTFLRIEVSGEDGELWKKLRSKLVQAITNFLEFEIDPIKHSSIKEEAQKFTSALLDYGKSKLNKPGIDNDKTLAEIEEIYGKVQKTRAEARKINAEASAIELQNVIRKLKIALGAARVLMVGSPEAETVLFLKEIESFKQLLDVYEQGETSVPE